MGLITDFSVGVGGVCGVLNQILAAMITSNSSFNSNINSMNGSLYGEDVGGIQLFIKCMSMWDITLEIYQNSTFTLLLDPCSK